MTKTTYDIVEDGNNCLKEQQFEAALQHYNKALAQEGDAAYNHPHYIHRNIGLIHATLGDNKKALESCNAALEITPHYAEAHYDKANNLFALERDAEAVVSAELAIFHQYSDLPAAFLMKGKGLHGSGRYSEAIGSYLQVPPSHSLYEDADFNMKEAYTALQLNAKWLADNSRPDEAARDYNAIKAFAALKGEPPSQKISGQNGATIENAFSTVSLNLANT